MPTSTQDARAWLLHRGSALALESASVSADEDSFCWQLSATLIDPADWQTLKPSRANPVEVVLQFRGQSFGFIVEGRERQRSEGGTQYSISGRSQTARLTERYAAPITATYGGQTASSIAAALCAAAGLSLQWSTVDWPVLPGGFAVTEQSPLSIIQALAAAVGAVVQTSADGLTLIVRPRHPLSPSRYAAAAVAAVLSDDDELLSPLSEYYEQRPGYNRVRVGAPVTGDGRGTWTIEQTSDDAGVELRIWSVPFQAAAPVLRTSAGAHAAAIYRGTQAEQLTERVEIVGGAGRVARPVDAVISTAYEFDNLSAVTIAPDGAITTATAGQSLLSVTYSTRFHRFGVVGDAVAAQFWVEE